MQNSSAASSQSHLRNAGDQLGLARDHLIVGVADAATSSIDAAREVRAEVNEDFDSLFDHGKGLLAQAVDVVRSRPWVSLGSALAVGFIAAKLTRRH